MASFLRTLPLEPMELLEPWFYCGHPAVGIPLNTVIAFL